MRARSFLRSLIFCLGVTLGTEGWAEEADPFGPSKWQDLGTENGVRLGRKNIPDSELFAVRGETVIPAPLARVASVIVDHRRWLEWTKSMSGVKLLGEDAAGTSRTVYQAFDLPFPVTDRDVVYTYGWKMNGKVLEINGSTRPFAKAPETNGVRMFLVNGRWFLTPVENGKKTHLVLEILMDPKGSMPTWFVNLIQRRYPVETLGKLMLQVQKPDIEPLMLAAPEASTAPVGGPAAVPSPVAPASNSR